MLKDELKKKIPKKYQETPEYNIFLKIIKQKKLTDKENLSLYIAKQIKEDQDWLNSKEKMNTEGTMNRWIVQRAKRLDFYKTLQDKIIKLL